MPEWLYFEKHLDEVQRLLPSDLLKSKIMRQIYYFTYLQLLPRFAEKAQ